MAELLRRHWGTAVQLAERVLGSADLARDAAQEAAIAAMTDVERLRSPDRFGAWFCGITLNVARRWLRQDAVRLFYLQSLSHREVADELGISIGAVKARLHQARAALAPRLAPFNTREREAMTMTSAEAAQWTEVTVTGIGRGQRTDREELDYVMLLDERDGDRRLPIWIGPSEASVLALAIQSVEMPRPFPYKLAAGLVEAAGSRITEVRITKLTDSVFYAVVEVLGPTGPREVDARPSDAVNLAVVTGAPIQVNTELFSAAVAPAGSAGREVRARAATADIAAEAQQRMRERHARPAASSESADE